MHENLYLTSPLVHLTHHLLATRPAGDFPIPLVLVNTITFSDRGFNTGSGFQARGCNPDVSIQDPFPG